MNKAREKVLEYIEEVNATKREKRILESDPQVVKYFEIKEELRKRENHLKSLKEDYQHECTHPLWYFLVDDTDSYEQRQLWRCVCLECGEISIAHSRQYKDNLIIGDVTMGRGKMSKFSHYEVQRAYNEYRSSGKSFEEIRNIMLEQYAPNQAVKTKK